MKSKTKGNKADEGRLFLKAMQEDGIEEIYLAPPASTQGAKSAIKPVETSALSNKIASSVLRPPRNDSKMLPANVIASEAKQSQDSIKNQLLELREKALQCTLCSELATTRKSVVFGAGNIKAKLMFVGEAPGSEEDIQGLPFVGRAGQLLTKIIESIGLDRKQVFIANVLKCRPPGNRQPQPDEILNCQPYLNKQIELIRPKVICALGSFAARTLLKSEETISHLRGRFYDFPGLDPALGIKVLCTFHPAYLLRNPGEKRKVWEDMKMIKKELESE